MGAFVIRQRGRTYDTILRGAHDAFRRDLDRLAAAAAAGKGRASHVRAGWENFKDLFGLHQELTERVLWPRVERAVGDRRAERGVLTVLRADNDRIGSLIGRVDAVMRDGGDLPSAVRDLRAALEAHVRHEATGVLPLAESVLAAEEWEAFAVEAGRRCEARTPTFVPWVVDGIAPIERSRFLAALPEPLRDLNRVTWEPRYRKRRLWSG
ncbi:hemerythrin HHE cation binding domain-containing protein [Actinomadura pelletieri DSM 43383]|uniref:Hemerythrin HHE cation binding domain-containing protein n=1 Tax=Actinomadura pelletieri DSM 43383 TaxID=1120940 RepID=A0A495QLW3_9ACTN|nr:hemerythrin domain-containing protein [Actinomadura pelletieri]RKS73549.1 hemerythrin HHE cation binding domain-containing protein [Actinomadura pelletieri DSM 43383]